MESPGVSVSITETATVDQLKAELSRCIGQMQSSCQCLQLVQSVRSCRGLLGFLLFLVMVLVVIRVLYGPDMGAIAVFGSFLVCIMVLCGVLFKLPSSRCLVGDLKKHAAELSHTSVVLKQRVDEEVWIRSMSSRWRSVEELQETGADVQGVVETLGSVVNAYLLSDLSKKLKQCQKNLKNI